MNIAWDNQNQLKLRDGSIVHYDGRRQMMWGYETVNGVDVVFPPLMNAAQTGNLKEVNWLLDQGADPNIVLGQWTPFTYIQVNGIPGYGGGDELKRRDEICDALVAAGADPDFPIRSGGGLITLLMWAAGAGDQGTLQQMIDWGATINRKDNDGDTALMYAVSRGNARAVEALLKAGADANTVDSLGQSLLLGAANQALTPRVPGKYTSDFIKIVRDLLKFGADPISIYKNGFVLMDNIDGGIYSVSMIRRKQSDNSGFDKVGSVARFTPEAIASMKIHNKVDIFS